MNRKSLVAIRNSTIHRRWNLDRDQRYKMIFPFPSKQMISLLFMVIFQLLFIVCDATDDGNDEKQANTFFEKNKEKELLVGLQLRVSMYEVYNYIYFSLN